MNLRNELKSVIAKRGTNFKKICETIAKSRPSFTNNNISSKITRNTIRFEEVEQILKQIGYKIEFVEE